MITPLTEDHQLWWVVCAVAGGATRRTEGRQPGYTRRKMSNALSDYMDGYGIVYPENTDMFSYGELAVLALLGHPDDRVLRRMVESRIPQGEKARMQRWAIKNPKWMTDHGSTDVAP